MATKRAEKILPKELLKEIQNYIQGEALYIPKLETTKKSWGEKSGLKRELDERNMAIKQMFQDKTSIAVIANTFHLSEETIKKIVYKK